MPQENLEPHVPRCFVAACDHLLYCAKGGHKVRPSVQDMAKALAFTYLFDEMSGLISAIGPDGTIYEFDMSAANGEVRITANESNLWLIWFTMQSLAGLTVETRGLTAPVRYSRTVSDGATTLTLFTYGMNCDEEGLAEVPPAA